jgi:glyoxylase-like metal-dependent hydrolase (beta-lactamase superfamily II)
VSAGFTWPTQRLAELADGVIAVLQGEGEAGVSNAGIVADGGRALVVDTFMFPEMADGLVTELKRRAATPETVVITHHHVDHIGGATRFPDARVIAHPRTVETVERSGHPVPIYNGFMPAFCGRFDGLEVVTPEPTPAVLDLPLGAELPAFSPAHTPADTAVWLPDQRVLFAGDLCFFGVTPLALQGLVSSWVDALDDLIALDPATVVPGHGPVGGVAEIRVVRQYLAALRDAGRAAVAAGASLDDAVAEFDAGPVAAWFEPERLLVNLERAMQEARGEIDVEHLDAIPPSFARLLH